MWPHFFMVRSWCDLVTWPYGVQNQHKVSLTSQSHIEVIKRRLMVFCWYCDEGPLIRRKKFAEPPSLSVRIEWVSSRPPPQMVGQYLRHYYTLFLFLKKTVIYKFGRLTKLVIILFFVKKQLYTSNITFADVVKNMLAFFMGKLIQFLPYFLYSAILPYYFTKTLNTKNRRTRKYMYKIHCT